MDGADGGGGGVVAPQAPRHVGPPSSDQVFRIFTNAHKKLKGEKEKKIRRSSVLKSK